MKEYFLSFVILIFSLFLSYLVSFYSISFLVYKLVYELWLLIFIIHILMFLPSYFYQTEHYYDLTGGITYISCIIYLALGRYFHFNYIDDVPLIVSLFVSMWTLRLSSFLFLRVKKTGKDIRFNEIKKDFKKFLLAFLLSGLWVFMCLLPTIVILTSSSNIELNFITIIGIVFWIVGFIFEVVADKQKTEFNKNHKGKFISTGLWSISQHPNYFGEFTLWLGITIISLPYLEGLNYVILISPIFIYYLLTNISGVNLLQELGNKRWGRLEAYKKYKKKTPIFFPKIFKFWS